MYEDKITYLNHEIYFYYNKLDKPLLFLHGLNMSAQCIKITSLNDLDIIRIDLPGYGKSQMINNLSFMDLRTILTQIKIKLKLSSFAVGGFCLGSIIALDYAIENDLDVNAVYLFELMINLPSFFKLVNSEIFRYSYNYLINCRKLVNRLQNYNQNLYYLNKCIANSIAMKQWNINNKYYLNLMREYQRHDHLQRCSKLTSQVYLYYGMQSFKQIKLTANKLNSLKINIATIVLNESNHFKLLSYFTTRNKLEL